MAFQLDALLRLVHIAGAALWIGGAVFLKAVVMKNVDQSGPAGKGFMLTVARNGGWGKFIGPIAIVTIVAGLLLYWRNDIHTAAMEGPNAFITLGMATGIVALGFGLGRAMPNELAVKKIADTIPPGQPPNEEQAKAIEGHAAAASQGAMIATVLAGVTFLMMAGRFVVT